MWRLLDPYLAQYNAAKTEMPPILDLEESSVDNMPASQVATFAWSWLQEVEAKTNRTPILYIDENMIRVLQLDARFARYTPWIAAYSGNPPNILGPWLQWVFWQFTDNGEQHADTDYFYGDLNALAAICKA